MKNEKEYCKKDPKSNVRDIYKTKFLVPDDWTVSWLSFTNRKRIEIKKGAAFCLLPNGRHLIDGDALFPNPNSQ